MIKSISDLISAAATFQMAEEKLDERERGRIGFVTKFPISRIQSLSLDEYCIGTNENSFCYWLEYKDILFGIGGGNASKFGLYKSKDGNYYEETGVHKEPLQGPNLESKFSHIKNLIVQGLNLVEQDRITEIETAQIPIWNIVLLKIFTLYFPEKFLTFGDPEVIKECARSFGITEVELKNENSILINYLCRKKISEIDEFSSWEYDKIGTFIWETFRKSAKRDYFIIGSKYGDNASKDVFPEMLSRSVIATGFAPKFDLSKFYNEKQSEVKEFLSKNGEQSNSITALKHFLSIKPGDLIAVKGDGSPKGSQGYLSIIGIAEAIEFNGKVYEYDPNGLGHIIHVKYLDAPIFKEFSLGGYGRTVHKLSNDEHIREIFSEQKTVGYFSELKNFLDQSLTTDLRTSGYSNTYQGLSVKVSFGQGNQAHVPWIAFLNRIDNVQDGIYPVYLYYKAKGLLILAYGISETRTSNRQWNTTNIKTIDQYFSENNLGRPERYGSSFVFKVYDIKKNLIEDEINSDLSALISIYKANYGSTLPAPLLKEKFSKIEFHNSAVNAGLFLDEKLCSRICSSLLTKPFVILTGLSGSGKTKLAQAFVQWICQDESQYRIIPVGADWTNREPLLGYPNGLDDTKYVTPESGVLNLIVDATKNTGVPYF